MADEELPTVPLSFHDLGVDPSFNDIIRAAAKRGYVLEPGLYHSMVSMVLRRPTAENMDILREWWMRAPIEHVVAVRRAIMCFAHPTTKIASGLASRVMTDVPMEPLSVRLLDLMVERIDPAIKDIEDTDSPDVLWNDLAFWALSRVVSRKQQLIEQEKARLIIEMERMRAAGTASPLEQLRLLGMAKEAAGKTVQGWLHNHPEKLDEHLDNVLAHLWSSMAEEGALAKMPVDMLMIVLDMTTAILPVSQRRKFTHEYPVVYWLKMLAGETELTSVELRKACLKTFARKNIEPDDLQRLGRNANLVRYAAKALVGLGDVDPPGDLWLLSIFGSIQNMVHVDLSYTQPYLYEMAVLRMLSVQVPEEIQDSVATIGGTMCEARTAFALSLLERMSVEYPDRNIVRAVFWAVTDQLKQIDGNHIGAIRAKLTLLLSSRGNREAIQDMWSLCSEDHLATWRKVFGGEPSSVMASKQTGVDAISNEPLIVPLRFAKEDTVTVSLETMLRHFATQGMTNPFTNSPVTWASVAEANPGVAFDD